MPRARRSPPTRACAVLYLKGHILEIELGTVMANGSVLLSHQVATFETWLRLEKCWKVDVNWNYYPEVIRQVCAV